MPRKKETVPNYTVVTQRVSSYNEAAALLPKLQAIFSQCKEVSTAITLYQAGTNADFNTAVNAIFTQVERAQLASMLTNVNQLVSVWTAQHATLLAFNEQE